jgi:PDZ domain-containing secreted protein
MRRILAICGFLVIPIALLVLFLGTVIRLPYVIFSPGSATPVAPIVEIKGARTFKSTPKHLEIFAGVPLLG